MENRTKSVVRFLLMFSLLALTAIAMFVAGFGASLLLDMRTERAPAIPPASPTPQATAVPPDADAPTPTPFPTPLPPTSSDEETFQLFWEVWRLVEQNYYGELPELEEVTYGAIRGMLATLGDEYTSFIEPEIAAILNEDATGTFEGIGAFVSMRADGKLEISALIPGQPAEAVGLLAGDRVLAVNGESIVGYGIYEAIALIRGPAGTSVTLLVERPDELGTFEVTVTRARIEIPLVVTEMREDGIAYIRLTEFSSTANAQMEIELRGLLAQEPVGLVFDLRSNPGGWLDQAVRVADLFLDEGVVLIERSSDGRENLFNSRDGDLAETIPLVVLVNGGSASASEIVAGAIQARGRAILIGETTLGKGSVQRPYRLSDGSELRVTIARWYTPDDVAIHGQGLTPDIEAPIPDDLEPGQDPQLDAAVNYLLTRE